MIHQPVTQLEGRPCAGQHSGNRALPGSSGALSSISTARGRYFTNADLRSWFTAIGGLLRTCCHVSLVLGWVCSHGAVLTEDTIIAENDATYDGQNLIIDGATVTINGLHSFISLHLTNGAVLTHAACTTLETYQLALQVLTTMHVDAGCRIDVTGKGYLRRRTTGNVTEGAASGRSGGSYGGLGGDGSQGQPNQVYGDYTLPNDWGSGGDETAGGGLIRIQAESLVLDGDILANGQNSGGGGGSGGGIHVQVGQLSGAGTVTANGGGASTCCGYAGGGGGRIAVYAQDFSGFDTSRIASLGGRGRDLHGGAGTVYLRDTDEPTGVLIIDDKDSARFGSTPLGLAGTNYFPIPDVVIIRGNGTRAVTEHPGLVLDFQNALVITNSGRLTINGDLHLGTAAPLTLADNGTLLVTGTFTSELPITVDSGAELAIQSSYSPTEPIIVTGNGLLQITGDFAAESMILTNGGTIEVTGNVTSGAPLTISDSTLQTDLLVAPALSILNDGILTSQASTDTEMHALEVEVSGTVHVDAGCRIDVTGKGYLRRRTTGNVTEGAASGRSGGSYGGLGGDGSQGQPNQVYGDYTLPNDWGSGGDETAGGGLIRIQAGSLVLDGDILANGQNSGGGGGSGGGILIQVEEITGAGSIKANGGGASGNYGSGGGGRIAVRAQNFESFAVNNIESLGGSGGIAAGAGTVYLKDTGEPTGVLIIDDKDSARFGSTPLGLAGTNYFPIPDVVIIRGNGTRAVTEHPGLVLEFQNALVITNSGRLTINGDLHLGAAAPLTLADNGTLLVTGTFTSDLPITVDSGADLIVQSSLSPTFPISIRNGGLLKVTGSLSADNVSLSSGNLDVSQSIISTTTLYFPGGSIVASNITSPNVVFDGGNTILDHIETSSLLLTNGAVLSCPELHTLNITVSGPLTVASTSSIDVSGNGYPEGQSAPNIGPPTNGAGGSYGGRGGNSQANQPYGDFADPEDLGTGGGTSGQFAASGRGGGLLRITSHTLALAGNLLANGGNGGGSSTIAGGGSGGGIRLLLVTLTGSGQIQANAGNGFAGGGGGGGGRVAIYAQDFSSYDFSNLAASGGRGSGSSGQHGATGTVHVVQGRLFTHARAHSPAGFNGGYVSNSFESISIQFNRPINTNSFDPSLLLIDGPLGEIQATGFSEVGDRTYQFDLPFEVTENGRYNFTLLPDLRDEEGFPLDQNANGIPGEPVDDDYRFTIILDTVAPRIRARQ